LTMHYHLPLSFRPAASHARQPAWSQYIRRLAVDAIGRVDSEAAVPRLVDASRTHACVESRYLRRHVRSYEQVAGNRIACRVPGFEHRIYFAPDLWRHARRRVRVR